LVYIGACAIFASRVELQGQVAHSLFVVLNLQLLFGRVQVNLRPSDTSGRAIGKVIQNQQTEDGAKAK